MAFSAAIVLLGRRGAGVGAVGGLVTGGSVGALIHPDPLAISRKASGLSRVPLRHMQAKHFL